MTENLERIHTSGDFLELLKKTGQYPQKVPSGISENKALEIPQGTTVLAFHYKDGVIVAGDRRATAGNAIMYDRCDKVIPIDDFSLMAIAGVPATAFEMARVLSHNFEYYSRSQLRAMSTEGKVRALSRLLKDNVAMALQGVGGVSPLFAIYDKEKKSLFLARDRAGKKPLYIYQKGDKFGFSSEINSLKFLDLTIDEEDIKQFLSLGFCESGYKEIKEFPAGCYGVFKGDLKIEKYFNILYFYQKPKIDFDLEVIHEILDKSVKNRLLSSDVEVGAFLSGGIDSGLVVA